MTALQKYARLEAVGVWRESDQGQRRDVIVSIGDATLVITDSQEKALAHWSLAAITRVNPGLVPALYHPEGDKTESLELPKDPLVTYTSHFSFFSISIDTVVHRFYRQK